MLRSSFFDDPFFSGANEHMRTMDMMFDNSFGLSMGHGDRMALPYRGHQPSNNRSNQVAQHGMFNDPFAHFGSMFSNMHSMMSDMRSAFDGAQIGSGNGQVFQQSSFMSYSNADGRPPKIYQASSSLKHGPDGVKETRKTLRDSEAGIDKIAVGHHIKDRGHVIERSRINNTGEINENREYVNLDEEDAEMFEQEYKDKWQSTMRGLDQRRHAERSRHAPLGGNRRHAALPDSESRRRKVSYKRDY